MTQAPESEPRVHIPQAIVIKDLAELLEVTPVDLIKELMKSGVMATINQVVDFDTAAVVATDLGFAPEEEGAEPPAAAETDDQSGQVSTTSMRVAEEGDEGLTPRPPVVTVMGHVDQDRKSVV